MVTVRLTAGKQVLVPNGVCNGFQSLGDVPTQYLYCFDSEWVPGMAGTAVNPLDPALGIEWPLPIDVEGPSTDLGEGRHASRVQDALTVLDLTDLDNFANGFPHDLFRELRRERPVFFHEPTDRTPGGEGFWVLTRHADVLAAAANAATFSSHRGGARVDGGTLIEDLPDGFAAGVLLNMMDDPRHNLSAALDAAVRDAEGACATRSGSRTSSRRHRGQRVEKGTCDFLVEVAAELPLQAIAGLWAFPRTTVTSCSPGPTRCSTTTTASWASPPSADDGGECGDVRLRPPAARGQAAGSQARRTTSSTRTCTAESSTEARAADVLQPARRRRHRDHAQLDRGRVARPDRQRRQWCALEDRPFAASDRGRGDPPLGVVDHLQPPHRDPRASASATTPSRAGDKVTLWWASANRDEEVFAEPFRFDVRRDPNPHLAFGHGTHFCLGANLARLEIRLVLTALLDRVATIELAGPPEWTRSNKHNGIRHLRSRSQPADLRFCD